MATVNIGNIKFTWKGTYNAATAYAIDDIVYYNGSSYVCIQASTGNLPTVASFWEKMAQGSDLGSIAGLAQGDIVYYNGTDWVRLAAGTSGNFLRTGGAGANPTWAALNEYNDEQVQNNIALLAFKIQTQNSLSKFNLDDQYIDEFNDATGIDVTASSNERAQGGGFLGLSGVLNWWGDGFDGAGNITSDTNIAVQNPSGAYDGDMVVQNYSSLTVAAGATLSVSQPCRGLMIFVDGDCTINGTISMRGKGAFANPTSAGGSDAGTVDPNGIQIPFFHAASSETLNPVNLSGTGNAGVALANNLPVLSGNGYIFNVARQGAAGGGSRSSNGNGYGGSSGSNQTGGGGGGGTHDSGTSGAGNYGSCFGGGSGGGGARTGTGTQAAAWSGQGGSASGGASGSSGGQGNPHGTSHANVTAGSSTHPEGVGGLIGLFVKGNLTIGSAGSIDVRGSEADDCSEGGGGTSGSGAILIGYAGSYTNNGSVTAASVPGNPNHGNGDGGAGGAGMTEIQQVDLAPGTANNMTLISNVFTANAIPSKGDFIMQYTDKTGTATLNTDLKAYISRDNGTTYTEGTLVAQGSIAGKKLATFHNLALGGTGSTNLKWKIETLNQTSSKVTKIDSVAIGWSY